MSGHGDFTKFSLSLTTEMYRLLKQKAGEKKIPISRLIWYALDNELECGDPFEFSPPKVETVFVPHSYTEEAKKIYDFLIRYKEGMDIDMMLVMRRTIGVPNKMVFMLGLRELLATKLAVESKVAPRGKFFKDLNPDLTWIRLTPETLENLEKNKKALEVKQAKLQTKVEKIEYQLSLNQPIVHED